MTAKSSRGCGASQIAAGRGQRLRWPAIWLNMPENPARSAMAGEIKRVSGFVPEKTKVAM
jgi:hypothetical protein